MPSKSKKDTPWQGDTLPDYLREGLDIVFVGLNPGLYSAQVGHYFAYKQNRFWSALSASGLVPEPVGPADDARLLEWGIGLTDIVKRPTRGIHELKPVEFRRGAKALQEKLERYRPRVVCFVGLTGYRVCCGNDGEPGRQTNRFGGAQVFVVPSTSPRNARYSLERIVATLRDLQEYLRGVRSLEEV
ncbi:MAG TPA: mismatch-specific DNA-glycosylase [Candidatus Binatia bacterium]|nr:mismatch-specific DNA-glycosylase [Candidatus Binatia bacterium]